MKSRSTFGLGLNELAAAGRLFFTGRKYKKLIPPLGQKKTQPRKVKKTNPEATNKSKANNLRTKKEMRIVQVVKMITIVETTQNILPHTRRVK